MKPDREKVARIIAKGLACEFSEMDTWWKERFLDVADAVIAYLETHHD